MDEASKFVLKVRRSAKIKAPLRFTALVSDRLNVDAKAWMQRNSITSEELTSTAVSDLAKISIMAVVVGYVSSLFLTGLPLSIMMIALALLPVLSAVSLVQAPARYAAKEESDILMESTTVIGMISMSMMLSPSIERAVSYSSVHGNGALSARLRSTAWGAMAGWKQDLGTGINELSSSLSDDNRNLKLSFQMIMSATAERSRTGLERLLDKANELVVQGVREKMDRYITSLSFPTMVLFAFGVLLPVMLFSLVPMFSMKLVLADDTSVAPTIGFEQVAFLMLIIFPACTFLFAQSTLRKHPMRRRSGVGMSEWKSLMVMASLTAAVGAVSFFADIYRPYLTIVLIAAVPAMFALARYARTDREASASQDTERELVMALFQVGNSMLSGNSIESALLTSASSARSQAFRDLVSQVMHRVRTEGVTMEDAFGASEALSSASPLVRNAFLTVAGSSGLDPRSSGRTAVNLAKYISELRDSERKGRERMRSVVDMMSYTSMLFAPIVIGVTGSLYDLVSGITGTEGSSLLTIVGGLYVIELCAIVSYFNGGLLGNNGFASTICDFSRRAPVAAISFSATSLIAGQGLSMLF